MKKMLIPMILAALLCLMTGCAGNTEAEMQTPGASPMMTDGMPDDMPSTMPDDDGDTDLLPMTPGAGTTGTAGTINGLTTAARARDAVQKIEEELVRLSEVKEVQAVAVGNTALIALSFDSQYKGGVDDRIEKMVKERVKSVSSALENVIVTDDSSLLASLATLGDSLDGNVDMTGLEKDLEQLITRVKGRA